MNSDLKLLLSCYIHFCDIRKNCWMLAKVDAKSDFLRQRKTFLQTMNSDLKLLLSCYIHFCDIRQNCWMLAKVDAKNDFLRQRKTFLQTVIWILIWKYYYLVISIFAIYAKIVEC